MMTDGQCPRCNTSNVFVAESGIGIQRDATSNLRMGGGMFDGTMPIRVKDYVCTNCGFWESYINDQDILAKIVDLAQAGRQWQKAGQ